MLNDVCHDSLRFNRWGQEKCSLCLNESLSGWRLIAVEISSFFQNDFHSPNTFSHYFCKIHCLRQSAFALIYFKHCMRVMSHLSCSVAVIKVRKRNKVEFI